MADKTKRVPEPQDSQPRTQVELAGRRAAAGTDDAEASQGEELLVYELVRIDEDGSPAVARALSAGDTLALVPEFASDQRVDVAAVHGNAVVGYLPEEAVEHVVSDGAVVRDTCTVVEVRSEPGGRTRVWVSL